MNFAILLIRIRKICILLKTCLTCYCFIYKSLKIKLFKLYVTAVLTCCFAFRQKDDKFVNEIDSLKGRATTKKKDDVYTLTVEHSIEDDAGNYSCIAFNKSVEVKEAYTQAICKSV